MKAIELFAGAGGLALGTSRAGFDHSAVVEWDQNACDTIRQNNSLGVISWPIHQADVRSFDFSGYQEPDLLAGGPPCQPFSIGGKHLGHSDARNLFPEAIRAIRETRPKAVMIENVKGLLRPTFSRFFEYVILQITYPELVQKIGEDWVDHLSRLERFHTKGRQRGLFYQVVFRRVNAADFGVPQRRERVIIVGFRNDISAKWSFPEPTHSKEALAYDQWVSGQYWERHKIPKSKRPTRLGNQLLLDFARDNDVSRLPWLTVRDAISDLPDPRTGRNSIANHVQNLGARSYAGHTGSPLDEPAKTLKAGDHGVPGGENMLLYPDREIRYFTVRESARIQTFPDDFIFAGSWTETMRQLGNAVPVKLAQIVAASIRSSLEGTGTQA
jgi:DNA (cytosine-5)-methyltransferase 1